MTIGEPHTGNGDVLALLLSQSVRHPKPQGQRPVIRDRGHAQLAARRLVLASQHEEFVAASLLPVLKPLFVAATSRWCCLRHNFFDPKQSRTLELTRFRGHLTLWGGGIHDAENETAVSAGLPASDD